ncbi:MAG: hypothetical protein WC897_00890 [Candidatus Gracilibacteria bacterium]
MDAFRSLAQRTKILIVLSTLFLFTVSVGVLVFGAENLMPANSLIENASEGAQADMLYVKPEMPEEGEH